jgi:hypothetical protein
MDPARRRSGRIWTAVILLLPFVYLTWMTPFLSDQRIAMDYPRISCPQQQELLFSLVHGSFPLFVPGFAAGQSASALTAGQMLHPLTHVAALAPGYWDGLAQDWNTFLRLMTLGIAHALLFRVLRRLLTSDLTAVALSTVTVFNLRMLNIFHGGAALESYTGHLFACVALFWCWLEPKRWGPRVGVILATHWTVCSGHPQFAYYSGLGTALVAFVTPSFLGAMTGAKPTREESVRYLARMAVLGGVGLALSAAYLLPFQLDFMSSSMRVGRGYEWTLWWGDTLRGTFDNFFLPLRSAASASFGGSALPLVAVLVPLVALLRVRVPRFVWFTWAVVLVVFLHVQGDRTPVHWVLWKVVPMFGSIRGPGRITLVLPVLLMVLLTWLAHVRPALWRISPLAFVAVVALGVSLAYDALYGRGGPEPMSNAPVVFHGLGPDTNARILDWGLAALVALAVAGWMASRGRRGLAGAASVVLLVALSVQTRTALRFGAWTEPRRPSATLEEMREQKREHLEFVGNAGGGLYSAVVLRQLAHTSLEPQLARLYAAPRTVPDEDSMYAAIDEGRAPDEAIVIPLAARVSGAEGRTLLPPELDPEDRVELTHASYNRVAFDVVTAAGALLVLGHPHSPNWRATVDGVEADVWPANGAYQAVVVPPGAVAVEFTYRSPAAFVGMLITCLTFVLAGVWVARGALVTRKPRVFTAAGVVLVGTGGFCGWWQSLEEGRHLGTELVWTPTPSDPRPNLAFGRPTSMSPIYPNRWNEHQELGRVPERWGSGRGVDGSRETSFRSPTVRDPFWQVDLGGERALDEIVLYGVDRGPQPAGARLVVEVSSGEEWRAVGETADFSRPELRFPVAGTVARRVRLSAFGTSLLTLTEVEVLGPAR